VLLLRRGEEKTRCVTGHAFNDTLTDWTTVCLWTWRWITLHWFVRYYSRNVPIYRLFYCFFFTLQNTVLKYHLFLVFCVLLMCFKLFFYLQCRCRPLRAYVSHSGLDIAIETSNWMNFLNFVKLILCCRRTRQCWTLLLIKTHSAVQRSIASLTASHDFQVSLHCDDLITVNTQSLSTDIELYWPDKLRSKTLFQQ